MLRAVEWRQQKLYYIDQTKLPAKLVKVGCQTSAQILDALVRRKIRGASAVGIASAFGAYLEIKRGPLPKNFEKFYALLEKSCRLFTKALPESLGAEWAVERMLRCARNHRDHKLSTQRDILQKEAAAILREDEKACQAIAAAGVELLRENDMVLTLGNAGALSSGGIGPVQGILSQSQKKFREFQVLLCETRPALQGARLTALELKHDKIPFQIITESMAAHFMGIGRVQAVLLGAHRVSMSGDVTATMGTYGLAMLAYHHRLPVYIAAPVSAFERQGASGTSHPGLERDVNEVLSWQGKPVSVPGAKALNPAFDLTPHKYISALVTELGIVRAPFDLNLKQLFSTLG